jgi:hypothetical protein
VRAISIQDLSQSDSIIAHLVLGCEFCNTFGQIAVFTHLERQFRLVPTAVILGVQIPTIAGSALV